MILDVRDFVSPPLYLRVKVERTTPCLLAIPDHAIFLLDL